MSITDYKLTQHAKEIANEIVSDLTLSKGETLEDYRDDLIDSVDEYADCSEYVIYDHYAHAICKNCSTDAGEEFLEDVENPTPVTYDALAYMIAYGELHSRVKMALNDLVDDDS